MKSRSFKLVKEFPLSPKLGTVIGFEAEGNFNDRQFNKTGYCSYQLQDCINYPEYWEEIPMFKVGDIVFIFSQKNSVCKLIAEQESNWLVEFSNGSTELVHKCWAIKEANKAEVLQFYKDRGWKKDVKFKILNNKDFNSTYIVSRLDIQNNVYVEFEANGQVRRFVISECELLPEQKTTNELINDLSEIEKYLLDNNWEFRDEDYGLEFYTKLSLDNELTFWDNELTIRNKLTDREIVMLHNPTINQIETLIKTFISK